MPNKKKTAASGSKRRVTVRRKGAAPDIDPAIAYAIATAVEAQDIEGLRKIVLEHEAQMATLRVVLFDFLIIFREEHYRAKDVVSKKRFATHIGKLRATLEANVPELKQYHQNQNDVDDLDATESVDIDDIDFENMFGDVAETVREIAAESVRREGEDESVPIGVVPMDDDLMDEMLERASEETDDAGGNGPRRRRHPFTQSRQPARRRR